VRGSTRYGGGGITELLSLGATGCFSSKHRLKTSSISSKVPWTSASCECTQDG